MTTATTYRPGKAERAKITEYLLLTADGKTNTSDLDLWEIEEAIADALVDVIYDLGYGTARDIAERLAPEYDGIELKPKEPS